MSPGLRALLAATGVVIAGAAIYLAAPGSDPVAVKTAALADGLVARAAEAEFEITPAGVAWLADAGIVAPKYVRLQFATAIGVGKESDAGDVAILPDLPFQFIRRVQDTAITTTTCASRPGVCPLYGASRPFLAVPHACAWRPLDAGANPCTRLDGGDPGWANTMPPGDFTGAGCQLKSCVEIAGDDSSP